MLINHPVERVLFPRRRSWTACCRVIIGLLAALLLGGCLGTVALLNRPELAAGDFPAYFAGDLPCADCPALRYELNLFADRSYYLRTTYVSRPEPNVFDDIGSWATSSDGRVLVLAGGRESKPQFRIVGAAALELLDTEGQPIDSVLNYRLERRDPFTRLEPAVELRGMFSYMADAAVLTECLTGQRLPVRQAEDYLALERAYLDQRREPGEAVLVSLAGRIALQEAMDADTPEPTLTVQRYRGIWPGESCGTRFALADLEGTYWKLTRLGEQAVLVPEGSREPHFLLHPGDSTVTGFSGCNRFNGAYERDGTRLSIGQVAMTRMACPAAATEALFIDALSTPADWRIVGQHLELFAPGGELAGRFEARYFD